MDAVFNLLLKFLTPASLGSFVRWALGLVGGWLLAQGWFTSDQVTEILAAAATVLIPLLWSLIQKVRQAKQVETALKLPAGSDHVDLRQAIAAEAPPRR